MTLATLDLAIVGWGNEETSFEFDPHLTTVGFNLPDVMYDAMAALIAKIEAGTPIPDLALRPPFLAERESS